MAPNIAGIHHVTAIAGDPQENLAFYTQILGLRLVKQTVNFDDPSTYHLYFGDRVGSPGTAMTFFPIDMTGTGTIGKGQVISTAFTVPSGSLDWWEGHLRAHEVDIEGPFERFGERGLAITDHDGLRLELTERDDGPPVEPWTEVIDGEHAIAGFDGVTIDSTAPEATEEVLDILGFELLDSDDDRRRFATEGAYGRFVDLVDSSGHHGRSGPGTVHHVAVRTEDEATQLEWRDTLIDAGYNVTPVRDRQYFKSIYFREPGGVLFEIATDGPGFELDESVDELGTSLRLPTWLEDNAKAIERQLPPLDIPREVTR